MLRTRCSPKRPIRHHNYFVIKNGDAPVCESAGDAQSHKGLPMLKTTATIPLPYAPINNELFPKTYFCFASNLDLDAVTCDPLLMRPVYHKNTIHLFKFFKAILVGRFEYDDARSILTVCRHYNPWYEEGNRKRKPHDKSTCSYQSKGDHPEHNLLSYPLISAFALGVLLWLLVRLLSENLSDTPSKPGNATSM